MEFLSFYKYHGAGNDFIILDGREYPSEKVFDAALVAWMCDRHFGIGADGLMVLKSSDRVDFVMDYYNADGRLGTMCGNGGRCIAAFANYQQLGKEKVVFEATDGDHEAIFLPKGLISLQMINVQGVKAVKNGYFLDTGSPHFVTMVNEIRNFSVTERGVTFRKDSVFGTGGTNVNFVEVKDDMVFVRTFERGVERETLACGTGVTAVALVLAYENQSLGVQQMKVQAMGGELTVDFQQVALGIFDRIWLTGPARMVFQGSISAVVPQDYKAFKNRLND